MKKQKKHKQCKHKLQRDKLNTAAKDAGNVTLRISSSVIANTIDEINIQIKLLRTDRPTSKLCKDFVYNLSANMNSAKAQISKIMELGGFFGRLLGLLLELVYH